MNRYLTVFLLLFPHVGRAQAPVRVEAPVREVTLFANGAELHHESRPTLPAGAVTVRVAGLAGLFDSHSLQVEVGRGAELVGTDVVGSDRPAAPDSVTRLRMAHLRAQAEVMALQEERALLIANSELKGTTAATWNADMARVAALYRERMRDVSMRLLLAQREQERLQQEVSRMGNGGRITPTGQDVRLRLRVTQAEPVLLRVRYRATDQGTGWQPKLDLRVKQTAGPLQAVSSALVTNGTGTAWNGVRLTLVNAPAAQQVERPNLQPWTVRLLNDADGNRRYSRTDDDEEAVGEGRLDGYAVKGSSAGKKASTPSAAPDSLRDLESALADRFRIAGRPTIPAGVPTTVAIETLELPMRAEHFVVPKLDPNVLLVAKVAGWQALRAPAARAAVYLAGNYVGETDLNTRAFNDTLEVALGADPQIVVSRTKRADRASRRLLGGMQKIELGYEINLRNARPTPVQVRVADQFPIPLDKQVTVEVTETGGATADQESGRLTWVVSLKPGESRKLPFAFVVEAPASQTLNLEYRERVIRSPKFR